MLIEVVQNKVILSKNRNKHREQIKITNIIINTENGIRFLLCHHSEKLCTVKYRQPAAAHIALLLDLPAETCRGRQKPAGGESVAVGVQGYDIITGIIILKVLSQRPLEECGSDTIGYFLNTSEFEEFFVVLVFKRV